MTMPLTHLTEQQRQQAAQKYALLQPHLENGVPLKHLAQEHGIPYRTLQRWKARYMEFGLAGLARQERVDKGTRHVPAELQMIIEGIALTRPKRSATAIQAMIQPIAEQYGWPVPHPHTVRRIIHKIEPAMWTMAHEGEKAYNDKYDLLIHRDSIRPNEIWQADHTWLPIWLANETGRPARPILTAIEDDYSRMIAGYFLSFDAPCSIHTALALRQAILRKTEPDWPIYGYPDSFYSDHGADFESLHIQQVLLNVHSLHIFSLPGMPRGRGRVERFFETVDQLFISHLPNYCPAGEPPTEPLLSLVDFERLFREWLLKRYHTRQHSTIRQPPVARWEADNFLPRIPESGSELDLLLLTIEKPRRVQQVGIHFEGYIYVDPLLASYIGEDVTIRYDPRDLGEIRVYYQNQFLCRAICPELAGEMISQKEIRRARNQRRKQLRQGIADRTTTAKQALKPHQPQPTPPTPQTDQQAPCSPSSSTPHLKFWRDD
jgi:putative transposase